MGVPFALAIALQAPQTRMESDVDDSPWEAQAPRQVIFLSSMVIIGGMASMLEACIAATGSIAFVAGFAENAMAGT